MSSKKKQQQQQQAQHPLLDNPDLMKQLLQKPTYPENHSTNDAQIAAASRRVLRNPGNWFCRPRSNPLTGLQFFPRFDDLPLDMDFDENFYTEGGEFRKFWILLAEISDATLSGVKFLRNEVKVKDKSNREFPVYFYPESDSGQFNYKSLLQGSTMVLFCPTGHRFLDGRIGLRMEHLETLRILPMPMAAVVASADLLLACSVHKCWQCKSGDKRPLKRCTGCGYARYCGPVCQVADYPRHRVECGSAGAALRQVARLVYFAYGSAMQQQAKDSLYLSHPFDLFTG